MEAKVLSEQSEKFRDIAELGKGGMGDVFLTVAPGPAGFNKLLVVKRLRHSLASDPEFLRMFLDEARLAARLNHPNIVQTYEVGFDGARHFIAMEYLQGQSLYRLLRRAATSGGVPLDMHLRVIADALAGLHDAHELTDYDGTPLEIVHRDFSPPNIFVLYDGQVKLVDFGIAKMAGSHETRAGIFKGKIQYISPEQYVGGAIDRRADIYSAGVMLWEAATRRRMWNDVGDLIVMQRVASGDVPLPSSVQPQVPKRLEAICMKALAVRKEDRYSTAAAMQTDIEDFLLEMGSRVSAREVGTLTAKMFADARAHVKILIEDQLKILREHSGSHTIVPLVIHGTSVSVDPPESQSYPALAPRPSRRRVVAGAGVGFALLLGVLMWWWSSSPSAGDATLVGAKEGQANAAPIAPVETSPLPVTSPPPAHVRFTVEAVPKNASVSIDDVWLPPNARVVEMTRDTVLHKIRAEALGYRAKTEWVRFDSADVTVKISLEPLTPSRKGRRELPGEGRATSPPPVAGETSIAPPAVAPPPPAPLQIREIEAPTQRPASAQPLDTGDPWKK
ncbi:MAG TPA: serine/threonine-protein kinase [Polyangiaceae bacterium]|nr:serine/threonine-protein kinase [Polyangiaceae bacterium]